MDDLISRSALMKYLRDYKWEFAMGSDFSKAMEMIEAQPTAYNVDAVVAEIKKHSYFMGIRESMVETIVRIVRKGVRNE